MSEEIIPLNLQLVQTLEEIIAPIRLTKKQFKTRQYYQTHQLKLVRQAREKSEKTKNTQKG